MFYSSFIKSNRPIRIIFPNLIKMALVNIVNTHEFQIVRPAQVELPPSAYSGKILELANHCFANLIFGINPIKLSDIFQIANGKPFPEVLGQIDSSFKSRVP